MRILHLLYWGWRGRLECLGVQYTLCDGSLPAMKMDCYNMEFTRPGNTTFLEVEVFKICAGFDSHRNQLLDDWTYTDAGLGQRYCKK
jgi:hypothetical protein